jgi:hypothetical protein
MRVRAATLAAALATAGGLAVAGCTPAPAVSVSPSTGLSDGQTVTVTGSGYSANSTVGIVQCPAGATSQDVCDGRTAQSFSADANGRYVKSATVYEVITDAHGTVTDCGAAPGTCVVASVYIHGFQGLATAPLAFA